MQAIILHETSVTYENTLRYIPKDITLQSRRYGNLKSNTVMNLLAPYKAGTFLTMWDYQPLENDFGCNLL